MSNEDIKWDELKFGYVKTDYRYVSYYKDGAWDNGMLSGDDKIVLSESACVLHYSQSCFEGLKAYRTPDGRAVTFRPDLNAQRMYDSAERLKMPPFPVDRFIDAVEKVVKANIDYLPPYGSGATLYLRPLMIGTNPVLGVKPATDFEFRIFATPVGPYFKGSAKMLNLRISDLDRAAPRGTGHIKAGLNYAMSLYNIVDAHEKGYDENIYLDPATRTKIEETGGANIIFVTKDKKLVVPKSKSILPSITRRSIVQVASDILGLDVTEREVYLDEISDFAECGLCGTAAVISPVGTVDDHGKIIRYGETVGEVTKLLYDTLIGIQTGKIKAPDGWIHEIV